MSPASAPRRDGRSASTRAPRYSEWAKRFLRGDRPVGAGLRADEPHQRLIALEAIERVLDCRFVEPQHLRDHRRVEVRALNRRCRQQRPIVLAERPELALDHAPHRLGQLALERLQARGEHARPVVAAGDRAAALQIAEQVDEEQRMPFGPLVDQLQQLRGQRMTGTFERYESRHGLL